MSNSFYGSPTQFFYFQQSFVYFVFCYFVLAVVVAVEAAADQCFLVLVPFLVVKKQQFTKTMWSAKRQRES